MDIVSKSEKFVFHLFKDKLSHKFIYHNYHHTFRVVRATQELIDNISLSEENKKALLIAAWFHDTGYVGDSSVDESESCRIARQFLEAEQQEELLIKEVERLIQATCPNYIPKDLSEEIIKDADTSHFAHPNYMGISELLRAEWKLINNQEFTDVEWNVSNRDLLLNKHTFYTDYAKSWIGRIK
ncbi:HD domain-containing protein [Gelidibacter japonicus]|uniref:HD domain-containing protein n=1 Tax=Gelidibacter japonicus TaxID=1962232 RepID=UPI0013CF9C9F|nr:HD domain-containing protein [Gelidibacter japonicus]